MNDPIACGFVLFVCSFTAGFLIAKLYFDNELKKVTDQMCAINRTTEANMKATLLAAMAEMEENYRASLDRMAAVYEEELRKREGDIL